MKQRTVVVTGATKGIGLHTSQKLSSQGHRVIGLARGPSSSFPGVLVPCDLSDVDQTEQALAHIKSQYSVDAIVNNVGISLPQPLGSIGLSELQAVYDLNVRTAVQVTQAFVERMKEQKWGRIVNIASRAVHGSLNRTSYAAAKSALIGCTRTWALELAAHGITVNAVAPGPIETELFRKNHPAKSREEQHALASIPMGRLGLPQEIAATIVFLLSEEASFITGQTIHVDGGSTH